MISASCSNARATASSISDSDRTHVTPNDDPPRTGLTNAGRPMRLSASRASAGLAARASRGVANPASRAIAWARTLSMQSALASVPHPTSGVPDSSISP